MKAFLTLALSLAVAAAVRAQQNGGDSTNAAPLQSAAVTITNGLEIVYRTPTDWNATSVQVVSPFIDDTGAQQLQTNRYNELQSGANFVGDDGWLHESDPSFVLAPGEARAWTGQSQLTIAASANAPELLRARLPDGQIVGTRAQGIFIFDSASGQTIQAATLRDSTGVQVETNKILFQDCFDGGGAVTADLLFVNTVNGWSQDVVLRQFAVDDAWLGQAGITNSESVTAEIWTEWVEGAAPQQTPVWVQGTMRGTPVAMADTQLDFGAFIRMDTGRAFLLGQENQSVSLVAKQWLSTPDGRQFLIESVPLALLRTGMQVLPQGGKPGKAGVMIRKPMKTRLEAMRALPRKVTSDKGRVTSEVQASIRPLKKAAKQLAAMLAAPGLVVDYGTINTGGITNYIFAGDVTSYLPPSASVTCYGTNTYIEGGSVIKYGSNAVLTVKTPLTCQSSAFRPGILCSVDDPAWGEKISGSSGNPTNGLYAQAALVLDASTNGAANASFNLAHLRIANAQTAIQFVQGGTNVHSLRHVAIVNAGIGVAPNGANFSLLNGLMVNVATNFGGGTGAVGDIEHLTADIGGVFQSTNTFASVGITNSLITGVTSVWTGSATNQVAVLSANTGVFQNLSLGSAHYLVGNSVYRGIGTASINPSLAGDLIDMCTTAPTELGTNYTVSSNLALIPVVPRDTNSSPDLGWHSCPLDYVVKGISVNGTSALRLLNGVAVGFYGTTGVTPASTANFLSYGLPENMNRLTLVNTVFEQPQAWITNTGSFTLISGSGEILRFTDVSFLAASTTGRTINPAPMSSATIQDSQLRGIYWQYYCYNGTGGGGGTLTLKNTLLERCYFDWSQGYSSTPFYLTVVWQNDFFNRSRLSLQYYGGGWGTFGLNDNLFDNCSSLYLGYWSTNTVSCSYNGYINTAHWLSGTGDKTGLIEDFIQGPLGNYYYPTSGGTGSTATLIDADSSRTAAGVGLAEYTTVLNQAKDTTNLDIGMHFVALEAHQASTEFSGYQGSNNWYYAKTTALLGSTIVYFATNGTPGSVGLTWYDPTLSGPDYYAWIWNNGQITGWDYDVVRIWQSPATVKLSVWGAATNSGVTGSGCSAADGALVWAGRNSIGLTPWSYLSTNGTPVSMNGRGYVQTDDALFFQVNKAGANNYCDFVYWDPVVILHRGASTLAPGLPDWFSDSNGDGLINGSDGTGDWNGDGVIDRNDPTPLSSPGSGSPFQISIERPANGSTVN
jgi:hypothetical protein